jgi:hypothetical protein
MPLPGIPRHDSTGTGQFLFPEWQPRTREVVTSVSGGEAVEAAGVVVGERE